MGKTKIEATEAEQALRDYFTGDAAAAGLKAGALERASVSADLPYDWRLIERFEKRRKTIHEHRRTRTALLAIGSAACSALWLVYAPHASSSNTVEQWTEPPRSVAPASRAGAELRRQEKRERQEARTLGLEVRTDDGWRRLEGCARHPDTSRLAEAFGQNLGLALQTVALRRALTEWLRGERTKLADVSDVASSADAVELAERVWRELGARAVLRARVRAGSVEEETLQRGSPIALVDVNREDLTLRMLERICRDRKRAPELEAIAEEAESMRTRALSAFALAARYPLRVQEQKPKREPPERVPTQPALRRTRKGPPSLREGLASA